MIPVPQLFLLLLAPRNFFYCWPGHSDKGGVFGLGWVFFLMQWVLISRGVVSQPSIAFISGGRVEWENG